MHTRDNRRAFPSHHERPRDDRPSLRWQSDGERQVMFLDGREVAVVRPDESREDQNWFAHIAIIGGDVRSFDDQDAARLWCESQFSVARAA